MDFFIHLVTEPDHLMWMMGMVALFAGKADKVVTSVYAVAGLALIVGHAVITGA
jgi:hypothetical protein